MPRTIQVEDHGEFQQRHGGNPLLVEGVNYLPDGATFTSGLRGGDQRHEPPQDDWLRLEFKRRYWEEAVRLSTDNFISAKNNFSQQSYWSKVNRSSCPPPRPDAKQILLHLKAKVEAARKELQKVKRKLAATPKEQAKKAAQQQEAERQREIDQQLSELNQIDI